MPRLTASASISVITAALISLAANADVRVPVIFSDGVVLQREATVPIWGWGRPGEVVKVRASWANAGESTATTGPDGRWQVSLATGKAGGPYTVTITGDTSITLRDVLLGEVWLASGQSNMEWPVSLSANPDQAIAGATNKNVRIFDVKNTVSLHPRGDLEGRWIEATGDRIKPLSAVAYHFAASLSERLDVPVGVVTAAWGGTRIEAWMPREMLTSPDYKAELADLAMLIDPSARTALANRGEDAWWTTLDTVGPNPIGRDWPKPGFDVSKWKTMSLPATLAVDGLDRFDGLIYFVREVELSETWEGAEATLELGPIDDRDEAFVNGTLVGSTRADGQWAKPRVYAVPEGLLKAGRNTIAVRVYDTAGPGGINGATDSMKLKPKAGNAAPIALAGDWKYKTGPRANELPPVKQPVTVHQNTAGALYDGMIRPLVPMRFAGTIWYQGESNIGRSNYADLFKTMITRWRADFDSSDMPFLFVQIAPYGYFNDRGKAAELRDQQAAALSLPNTAMVPTLDIGDPRDIHPRDKLTVGKRLAAAAMGMAHGALAPRPSFANAEFLDGRVRVSFSNARGLQTRNDSPKDVWVAGEDRRFHLAESFLDGSTLIATHPSVPKPMAVRYAWDDSCEASIWDVAGNPVPPFRSDDWKLGTWTIDDESFLAPLRSKDADFTNLFNGKDLTNWVRVNVDESTFTVAKDESGAPVIRCSGIPTGLLRTSEMFENYELELEFRHLKQGGNAGLFVHSDALPAKGVPFTRAIEVQIMDGLEGNGYTSDGDIFHIWGAKMKPENSRGGTSRAFPTERRINPSPRWNHYRVVSNHGEISLAVNGKVVSRGTQCSPRKGYICLEAEGSPIEFKNIRFRALPTTTPSAADTATPDEGFTPLYGGINLKHWNVKKEHEGHWHAADNSIVTDGQGDDLWTKKSYKDFVLRADWRWTEQPKTIARPVILPDGTEKKDEQGKVIMQDVPDAGDSGIYLRGSSKSQVNLWCWPIGSGEIYGYRTDTSLPADIRAAVTPKLVADAPVGQWNRIEITMKRDRVTVVLNDKTVISNAKLPGVAAEGPIALQKHDSPIQFANIYIKELKD